MPEHIEYPNDYQDCVSFHGHSCPGLAIGYGAVKAGSSALRMNSAEDEELVAVVENDSCAVDAVQVLLGCTFGKGNLIFRDWGKQVFTFLDRNSGKSVRVSFVGPLPDRDERHALRMKMAAGTSTEEDKARFEALKEEAVRALVSAEGAAMFEVREVTPDMPPMAQIVDTAPCARCAEPTMVSKLVEKSGENLCKQCAGTCC